MNIRTIRKQIVWGLIYVFISANTHAALTDIANVPLVTSSSASVKPNILFTMDNSGSMDWDYLPDWANSGNNALFQNAGYNGVAYDPAVVYRPPIKYTAAGAIDTTTYPSQTALATLAWTSVKNDGYGVQDTGTSNLALSGVASYYTFIPGEFCQTPALRSCSTNPVGRPYPAKLRWCSTTALTTCQAVRIETGANLYMNPRYPGVQLTAGTPGTPATPARATISVSGTNNAVITSIIVNGQQILSAATASSSTANTVATNIVNRINACTAAIVGNCQVAGFSASRSGSTVTISAPVSAAGITFTPIVAKTGTATLGIVAFSGYVAAVPATGATYAPGSNVQVLITPTTLSYPYPGTPDKHPNRTDCAGTTCTYAEEMTNYSNWWAYYHTRMQTMKSSASVAFSPLDSTYRLAFYSFNNGSGNTGTKFVNMGDFNTAQKNAWYSALFSIGPGNSTPLRTALTTSGRYYAGKLNGTNLQGVTVRDPLQYSCQQNFTIAATDGYWNEADPGGYQLNGSTAIGDQDGGLVRPFFDGGGSVSTTVTPATTVTNQQSLQVTTTTIPWTQTVRTTTGTLCGFPAAASACVQDNGQNSTAGNQLRTWCAVNAPVGNQCSGNMGSGSPQAFACRGVGSTTILPPGGTPCVFDGGGNTWCVYDGNTTPGTNSCSQVTSGSNVYICRSGTAIGVQQTVDNQTYNETVTRTITSIDNLTTTTQTTVVVSNGQVVSTNTVTLSSNVPSNVSTSSAVNSDTGAPSATTTWTSSGTSTVCVPLGTPSNTSAPVSGASTTVNSGPPTVTTISVTGPTDGTPVTTTVNTGTAVPNTLSDVTQYYYATDLRTPALANCTGAVVSPATVGNDVCTNNVKKGTGVDVVNTQHMTTFTLGLGASGYMLYSPTYLSDTSGDYFDVSKGNAANPGAGTCSWQSAGACNWPTPVSNSQTTIDDLWHAAVNGRGVYFSATNPTSLAAGLANALSNISAAIGTAAAATTSNPNVTSGDNFVFSSTYETSLWDGEVTRQQLSLTTGVVSSTVDWSAQAQLDTKAASGASGGTRTIFTRDPGGAGGKKDFTWGNLTAAQQLYFQAPNISGLSQFCAIGASCLSAASQLAAAGAPLVDFLRGDKSNQDTQTITSNFYRKRDHILGDIVDAEAVYVKGSLFNYADAGYAAFVTANASRQGMVYIASNDGMLHAFYAGSGAGPGVGGDEAWAYVPNFVLPNLYKLADKNYASGHLYYLDGTPVAQDVFFGGAWHTILVGGQNAGGRGYYALDVTDPANPISLWEFSDTNLGYTFGNPEIAKLKDGTWVVMFTSGYNNVSPGDGVGRLYVLNAQTGAVIRTISTGVGNTTTPSGLSKIRAWVDNATTDDTIQRVYGGDLLGNVWRFDVNGDVGAAGYDAQRLITLVDASNNPQPITAKPELGDVGGRAIVFVGTGRYLGVSDLVDTRRQSFYAIKDSLGSAALGNPRTAATNFVLQTQSNTTCNNTAASAAICTGTQNVRTSSSNAVNFATDNGWYFDLPDGGGATTNATERANTDPTLALGTLAFNTNIPLASACVPAGYSNAYFVDYRTGGPVQTANGVVSAKLGDALATRPVLVRLPNNTIVELTRMSDGTTVTRQVPIGPGAGTTRRISWRELTN